MIVFIGMSSVLWGKVPNCNQSLAKSIIFSHMKILAPSPKYHSLYLHEFAKPKNSICCFDWAEYFDNFKDANNLKDVNKSAHD